jgi:hypothetical protein
VSLEAPAAARNELPLRRGRRIISIEDALAPLRSSMKPAEFRRLAIAIASAIGIDSLVWLTDVARLSRKEAVEIMRWSADALLRSELARVLKGGLRSRR